MHEQARFNDLHKINQRARRRLREPIFENTNCDWEPPFGSTTDTLYVLIRRMKSSTSPHHAAALLTLALAVPLAACGSSTPGTGAVGNVIIKDANNYSSTSTLTIPTIQTAQKTDLTFTWDGIMKDLLCHTAKPIDNVAFLKIANMTQASVEQKLAIGQLNSPQVAVYAEYHTATAGDGGTRATSAMLTKFNYYDTFDPLTDYVESSTVQYMMLFTTGTTISVGAQSMVFIQPTAASTNTSVSAPDACSSNILDFVPTLSSMPVSIPIAGPWKIDWSQITKDNFGNALDFTQTKLDTVEVGFFQGKQPSDVQADFLNVEQDATALYTYAIPAGQKYVDLMSAPTMGGTFPGFADTSGTYAVAALCSTCQVPAPVVFSILQPL